MATYTYDRCCCSVPNSAVYPPPLLPTSLSLSLPFSLSLRYLFSQFLIQVLERSNTVSYEFE